MSEFQLFIAKYVRHTKKVSWWVGHTIGKKNHKTKNVMNMQLPVEAWKCKGKRSGGHMGGRRSNL